MSFDCVFRVSAVSCFEWFVYLYFVGLADAMVFTLSCLKCLACFECSVCSMCFAFHVFWVFGVCRVFHVFCLFCVLRVRECRFRTIWCEHETGLKFEVFIVDDVMIWRSNSLINWLIPKCEIRNWILDVLTFEIWHYLTNFMEGQRIFICWDSFCVFMCCWLIFFASSLGCTLFFDSLCSEIWELRFEAWQIKYSCLHVWCFKVCSF